MAPKKSEKQREVFVNYTGERQERSYPTNFIKTSKYTCLTYLPLSLLIQFRRYANIYFLFIAIIQSIKIISPLNPFSAIAPLVFVLGLSMIREGMEDYARHRSDNEVNAMPCQVIVDNELYETTWAQIKVGDIVMIQQDEMIPADVVILGSEFESGACYIETSSLDGEKNLKPKSSLQETQRIFNKIHFDQPGEIIIVAKAPNPHLHEFEASLQLSQDLQPRSLNQKQLLLRGAFLRNTKWVIGCVVYTGQDTKIMKNAEPGRIKESSIEVTMNRLILAILFIQILICISSAVLSYWWMKKFGSHHWYVWQISWKPTILSVISFFSYFLLYTTMIPISLVVSLEFVKLFQAYFIEQDKELFVTSRNSKPKVQTSAINEDLGSVEYIFTDKTGTLTCNQMEFKYCIIGNELYGLNNFDFANQNNTNYSGLETYRQNESQNLFNENRPPQQQTQLKQAPLSVFNFKDSLLTGIINNSRNKEIQEKANQKVNYVIQSDDLKSSMKLGNQQRLIMEYFQLLASAHECLASNQSGKIVYQGPSPDEITLVDAAMNMGFQFEGASASSQNFFILGKPKAIQLLNTFEFNSTRKRMSVIIRDNDGLIKVFVKGADNIIKSRLKRSIDQPFLAYIDEKLSEFSRVGLRTLLMAMKVLSETEYQEFSDKLNLLATNENRESETNILSDQLEENLYLLGATAVEDKLQPEVPETIADLLRANIKIWMLTGDKLETAENIAKSCSLIQGDFTVMRFAETQLGALREKIIDTKEVFEKCMRQKKKKCFVIEGQSLQLIMVNGQIKREFVKMAKNCESVVCCRVTPKQKAEVVKLIKDNLHKMTLAIGDGANDVNMIQEAHIGIGLFGNEGMRAVQSSDFALGEFRSLWRLLLVHGHWSYIRISEMILYFFYKNMIFTVPQFLFSFYNGFSAQTFYDDWYITFYNLFFTSVPLVIRATFDQDINYKSVIKRRYDDETIELIQKKENYLKSKFPLIYYIGQKKTVFTMPNFIFWWGQGFVHGMLVYFITLGCIDFEILTKHGENAGLSATSITIYTAIIFIVDIKIALYTKFWTCFNFLALLFLSLMIYFIYFILSNFLADTFSQNTPLYLIRTPHFYLIIALLNAIIFIFDLLVSAVVRELYKTEIDYMLRFKKKVTKFMSRGYKYGGGKNLILGDIEQLQLDKKEKGIGKEWGDSFFENLLDEKYQQEIQQQENRPISEVEMINTQNQEVGNPLQISNQIQLGKSDKI